MKLAPREEESLLVHQVGSLAQKRLARGVRLNYTEAVALIASQVQELIRDGMHSVADLMSKGRQMLGFNQVQPGVDKMISEVQVEGTFPDGTKLVTVHSPINRRDGDLDLALYGSFLPVPSLTVFSQTTQQEPSDPVMDVDLQVTPGELIPVTGPPITINTGRRRVTVTVTSLCDRPIQVGSHYHFIETNKYLQFDRAATYGMRLVTLQEIQLKSAAIL